LTCLQHLSRRRCAARLRVCLPGRTSAGSVGGLSVISLVGLGYGLMDDETRFDVKHRSGAYNTGICIPAITGIQVILCCWAARGLPHSSRLATTTHYALEQVRCFARPALPRLLFRLPRLCAYLLIYKALRERRMPTNNISDVMLFRSTPRANRFVA